MAYKVVIGEGVAEGSRYSEHVGNTFEGTMQEAKEYFLRVLHSEPFIRGTGRRVILEEFDFDMDDGHEGTPRVIFEALG